MFFKTILALASATIVALVWYVSPIMKPFPKLTGQYQVGLKTLELTNSNQRNSQKERTLVVHVFYPADDTAKTMEKAPYLGDKMPYFQKAVAQYLNIPEWVSTLLFRDIKINAVANVPIRTAEQNYPVILFSHGLLGLPSDMYVSILENIASHGYIVMAIDHPYFNELTLYRDSKVISSRDMSQQFQKMSPQEQKKFQSRSIETYKDDIKFIIDQLMAHNSNLESLYKLCDLERIAIMGHSAGGTAAIEFCREDARCKAAIDLDGWYDHVIGEQPINKPLLLMFGSKNIEISEPTPEYLKRKELTREQYFEQEQNITKHKDKLCSDQHCQMIIISNATHQDFSDEVLLKWPLRALDAADGYTIIHFINEKVIQFLNDHL